MYGSATKLTTQCTLYTVRLLSPVHNVDCTHTHLKVGFHFASRRVDALHREGARLCRPVNVEGGGTHRAFPYKFPGTCVTRNGSTHLSNTPSLTSCHISCRGGLDGLSDPSQVEHGPKLASACWGQSPPPQCRQGVVLGICPGWGFTSRSAPRSRAASPAGRRSAARSHAQTCACIFHRTDIVPTKCKDRFLEGGRQVDAGCDETAAIEETGPPPL